MVDLKLIRIGISAYRSADCRYDIEKNIGRYSYWAITDRPLMRKVFVTDSLQEAKNWLAKDPSEREILSREYEKELQESQKDKLARLNLTKDGHTTKLVRRKGKILKPDIENRPKLLRIISPKNYITADERYTIYHPTVGLEEEGITWPAESWVLLDNKTSEKKMFRNFRRAKKWLENLIGS